MKPLGPVFDKSWRKKCEVLPAHRHDVDEMIRRHYIGKWPGVCVLIMAMICDCNVVGAIVFALPPRETSKRYGGETWELARLWIDDSIPRNAETFLIAKAVRYIRMKCKSVKNLVSYADPSVGHTGIIYRAANWTPDGRTDQERKSPRVDYVDVKTGKRYSRRGHIPAGAEVTRTPRVSKYRFVYRMAS